MEVDEGASSGEIHQLKAVQPIDCDNKVSFKVILTTSIAVVTLHDSIVFS